MDNKTTEYVPLSTPFEVTNVSNSTCQHYCSKVLYWELPGSKVRLWDATILIPNAFFFIYLSFKVKRAIILLTRSNLQVFAVLFTMVFASLCLSILRCIISMTVHTDVYGFADRVMWLVLRFVLLAAELSVVTFGFFFGHLDTHTSIKRVVLVTFSASLVYSSIQGLLEFLYNNDNFHNVKDGLNDYTLFGHGGMIFWFSSSFVLFMIYAIICLLPLTRLKDKYTFPAKRSFYIYCLMLSMLNLGQGVGGVLLFKNIAAGMCMVDVTTYIYFSGFPMLVYFFFLYAFFSLSQSPSMLFSYRTQIDDDDDYFLPNHNQGREEFINSTEHTSQSNIFPENVADSAYFDQSVLAFSHNPLCPSLTSHPDLTLGTSHSISFPQNSKLPTGKDNKMKTFPA